MMSARFMNVWPSVFGVASEKAQDGRAQITIVPAGQYLSNKKRLAILRVQLWAVTVSKELQSYGDSGRGGIRTHGTVNRTRHFQCRTLSLSVTRPRILGHWVIISNGRAARQS